MENPSMTRLTFCSRIVPIALAAVLLVGLSPARTVRAEDADKPIRGLLVCGGCCHDYAKQKDILTKGISARANVEWTIAYEPDSTTRKMNPIYESADWAKNYDVVLHDECSSDVKDLEVIDRILKPHRDGLPAVVLHCGMHCYRSEGWPQTITPWFKFTGLQTTGHGPQLPIAITFTDKDNPITKGMADWTTVNEELYNNIAGKLLDTGHALAPGTQHRKEEVPGGNTVVWTNLYNGKTRVFATTLGHNNDTVADPRYLDLVTRGLLWSLDKLDDAHLKPAKKVLAE
jgi:type 1 glutamine amidotransferase